MGSRQDKGWAAPSSPLRSVRVWWAQFQLRIATVVLGGSAAVTAALGVNILGLLIVWPVTILVIAAPVIALTWLRTRRDR